MRNEEKAILVSTCDVRGRVTRKGFWARKSVGFLIRGVAGYFGVEPGLCRV